MMAKSRILLADDDDTVCQLVLTVLSPEYTVSVVHTGREAYDLLTSCRNLYALAILDVTMPEWNGYAAAEMSKGLGSDVPILIITGHSYLADNPDYYILHKPFALPELIKTVKSLIKRPSERYTWST